jgi:uncharacterized protein (TIGR02246 family)
MNVRTTELEAIDAVREAHVAALNAGDAKAWVACFAADGVQMPPNEPPNEGTARIQAWSAGLLAAFGVEFSLSLDEVELAGPDWAFERGSYRIDLTPRSGDHRISDTGKYLTVYRRRADDSWAMARDIWNSNEPPPV